MSKTQNLGIITSYGYAIAGGYVGTVEEYERYLASLPSYRDRAEAAAISAEASADSAASVVGGVETQVEIARTQATNAANSATAASQAAEGVSTYATAAAASATQAAASATTAADSATAVLESVDDAHDYAQSAIQSAQQAATYATNSASSSSSAATYATNAQTAETNARAAKNDANTAADAATASAIASQSWAIGGTGTRAGENTNNAKYWSDQAQAVVGLGDFTGASASSGGSRGLVPAPIAGQENAFLRGDGTWSTSTAGTASNIDYSNTVSGLTSTTVQGAIDEVYAASQSAMENAYESTDTLETTIADNDYIPFYDVSEHATKKILRSNFTVTVDSALSVTSTNPVQNKVITNALNAKADASSLSTVATTGDYSDLTGTPTLALVAMSGSYDDLLDLPSLGAAAAKGVATTVDTSTDLVTSAAVNTALSNKADKPTVLKKTMAAGSTTVTFTGIPTSGDYIVDFFNSAGIAYTAIAPSSGSVTLTYPSQSSAIDVYCKIEEV